MIRIRATRDADVVVAGGGPAGAAAATWLARAGFDVMLVDQAAFPRDKVCGDFVGPTALLELKKLGVTMLDEYQRSNVIREATLYLDGRALINHPIPDLPGIPSNGRVIPRRILDDLIYQQAVGAGVRVRERTRVTGYTSDADGVRVELTHSGAASSLNCRLLLGADGCGSVVAREVRGGKSSRLDRIVAVRAYFRDIEGPSDLADLYFTSDSFPGYYWLFPTGNGGANVGVGLLLETVPATETHPRDLLMGLVERDPALKARLGKATLEGKVKGWPLVTYNPRAPLVADGVMLLGDAAGLINPLNGEGIQYALLSASWAAETAARCLQSGDLAREALEPYAIRVAEELRLDMALAGMIVQLIRNRSLNPLWLHALKIITARAQADPDYATITGGVLAGLVPAASVLKPRIVISTARQAASTEIVSLLWSAVRGPGAWKAFGRTAGTAATGIVIDNFRHPLGLARWGGGVVLSGAELASRVGIDFLRPRVGTQAVPEAMPTARAQPYT